MYISSVAHISFAPGGTRAGWAGGKASPARTVSASRRARPNAKSSSRSARSSHFSYPTIVSIDFDWDGWVEGSRPRNNLPDAHSRSVAAVPPLVMSFMHLGLIRNRPVDLMSSASP